MQPLTTLATTVSATLHTLASGLGELVLPEFCPACRDPAPPHQPFCDTCTELVDTVPFPCPRCALPLPAAATPHPCLGCAKTPPPWTQARAPYLFGGPLAVAVRRFKLDPEPSIARPLARLLAPSLQRIEADLLVPVPLHPRRLRQREFNQSSLLARVAARMAGRSLVVAEALDRKADTRPQMTLPASARAANVRDAFHVSNVVAVRHRHIVLVDDVITTGATARACTEALLQTGAARVDLLALARAV